MNLIVSLCGTVVPEALDGWSEFKTEKEWLDAIKACPPDFQRNFWRALSRTETRASYIMAQIEQAAAETADVVTRVVVPSIDWVTALPVAIREATDGTILVVNTKEKKKLALIAAERMGKRITVEVAEEETLA